MLPIAVVVVPLLLVLPLTAIGLWSATSNAQQPTACGDKATQDKMQTMMHQAVDDAFQEHVGSLFLVWMKDNKGQPQRAANGIHQSVAAYIDANRAIERWSLKSC